MPNAVDASTTAQPGPAQGVETVEPPATAAASAVETAHTETPVASVAVPWGLDKHRPSADTPGATGSRPDGIASSERRPRPEPPRVQSLGPSGKQRAPWSVGVLSVLTLGVYAIVWHRRVNTEMRDFDPRMHVSPGRSTLAVAIPWIAGLLVSLAGAARILLDQLHVSLPFDPHFTVVQGYYLLGGLALVPYAELLFTISAVALVMTVERVRTCEECAGLTSDVHVRPARIVLWLLVPVTGGLIYQSIVQRRLNNSWRLAKPSLAARISQY